MTDTKWTVEQVAEGIFKAQEEREIPTRWDLALVRWLVEEVGADVAAANAQKILNHMRVATEPSIVAAELKQP